MDCGWRNISGWNRWNSTFRSLSPGEGFLIFSKLLEGESCRSHFLAMGAFHFVSERGILAAFESGMAPRSFFIVGARTLPLSNHP
jgi:hypothetical protein